MISERSQLPPHRTTRGCLGMRASMMEILGKALPPGRDTECLQTDVHYSSDFDAPWGPWALASSAASKVTEPNQTKSWCQSSNHSASPWNHGLWLPGVLTQRTCLVLKRKLARGWEWPLAIFPCPHRHPTLFIFNRGLRSTSPPWAHPVGVSAPQCVMEEDTPPGEGATK